MASLRKLPSGNWQATVCEAGRRRSKTFPKRSQAWIWAAEQEAQKP